MSGSGSWYEYFQLNRAIPSNLPLNKLSRSKGCYSLSIGNVELTNLKIGVYYRIHAYFYNEKSRFFFGRPYFSDWKFSQFSKPLDFNDVVRFYDPYEDESVVLILELVEKDSVNDEVANTFTTGWTMSNVYEIGKPITDCSTSTASMHFTRIQLYHGSPKQLLFLNTSQKYNNLRKIGGVIEVCLQTHQKMQPFAGFLSEFSMIGGTEVVPGFSSLIVGESELRTSMLENRSTCVLSEITISFGTYREKLEELFIRLVSDDRLYRTNKSPGNAIERMQILERRLRVGLHNGFVYIQEPHCVHLCCSSEQIYGTQSLRRKARPLSLNSFDSKVGMHGISGDFLKCGAMQAFFHMIASPIKGFHPIGRFYLAFALKKSESTTFTVNSDISLSRIVHHPNFAIVFVLDYLVGIKSFDGSITSSQSAILCWGAWCPFYNDQPNQKIRVPLTGGPRPNPDETLCFKNLMRFAVDSFATREFADIEPRIHLDFKYSLPTQSTVNFNLSDEQTDHVKENLPIRTESKLVPPNVFQKSNSISGSGTTFLPDQISVLQSGKADQVQNDQTTVVSNAYRSINEIKEDDYFEDASSMRKIDYLSTGIRVIDLSRTQWATLLSVPFTVIRDRNGEKPIHIDESLNAPSLNIELNDTLNTNEIIIQFLALAARTNNSQFELPQRIFFTVHFYRFRMVTTERLVLSSLDNSTNSTKIFVLKRIDATGKVIDSYSNGFTIKFTVDRSSLPDNQADDFILYLMRNKAIIEVWDADSLIPIGQARVPLKRLLRRGHEAVKTNLQAPIIQHCLPISLNMNCGILMTLANIGHPQMKNIDAMYSKTSAIVSQRLSNIARANVDSVRIRATPMNQLQECIFKSLIKVKKAL